MRRISLAILALCTTACSATNESKPLPQQQVETSSAASASSSLSVAQQEVEEYPSQLSVEHFRTMALSGSALTIGNVLERTAAFTKYTITYRSNGVRVSGTLALPTAQGPHPLIILNHGYIDPAVYTNGRGLRREQAALATAGFAVLHTDYRGHAYGDAIPAAYDVYDNALAYAIDSATAILAVREAKDPRINAQRVGMLGHSMGGGVTLHLLVAHPELIDAAVLYAPISTNAWANFDRWRKDSPQAQPTLAAFGEPTDNADAWDALSQAGHIETIEDPILLTHGTRDADVPYAWSQDLVRVLTEQGKQVEFVSYPNEGHEYSTAWPNFAQAMIRFFNEHLR